MIKNKLILGTLVIAAISGGIYLTKTSNNTNSTYQNVAFQEDSKEEIQNKHWKGAREYWEILHMNEVTGQVEQSDYDNARKIALGIPQAKNTMSFVEMGPDNQGGRTRAVEVDPNNDNIVYAGSVSGGVYKSTDGGNNWSKVGGYYQMPVTSVSSIAMTNDGTLYVACGFNDYSDGFQTCDGIYYSNDGGQNFTKIPGIGNFCVNKVIADRSKPNTIYFTSGGSNYLRRVENGNSTSPIITQIGNANGITVQGAGGRDIKLSPDGQHLLYSATTRVFVSNDGGNSFTDVSGSGPGQIVTSGMNRIESAVSFNKTPAGNYTMAVVMSSGGNWGGSYFSEDNGVTWSQISPRWISNPIIPESQVFNPLNSGGRSPQGNYNLVCTIVPGDPFTMVFGGVDLYRWRKTPNSNPIAGQFEKISFWFFSQASPNYVHADNHRLTWSQAGNLYVGNDGGLSKSIDTSLSVFAVINKGYITTQFYGIGFGPDGTTIGGTQDNGTLMASNIHVGKQFREVIGGDGFESEMSQLEEGAFLGSIYFSAIFRARNYTSGTSSIAAPCGTLVIGESCGSFATFFRLFEDENDTDTKDSIMFVADSNMVVGTMAKYLSKTFDKLIEYPLPTGLLAGDTIMLPDYIQSLFITGTGTGVYITRDVWRFTGSLNYSQLLTNSLATAFEFSKDGNTIWVGTRFGELFRITNLDSAYTPAEMDVNSPDFKLEITQVTSGTGSIITDISVDANDPSKVAFTSGGSGAGANIFYSSNAMAATPTFASKDGNLPAYAAFGCELVSDPQNNIKMIVGTEFGLYSTTSNLAGTVSWTAMSADEIGVVPVYDVRQQWRPWDGALGNVKTPGRVYVGTFGRGIWWSDDIAGAKNVYNGGSVEELPNISNIQVYPNPMSTDGNIKFTLNETSDVVINIYSLEGKMLKQMNLKNTVLGMHNITFSAQDFPAGTYLMTFTANGQREVKKFIKR